MPISIVVVESPPRVAGECEDFNKVRAGFEARHVQLVLCSERQAGPRSFNLAEQ